jgi:hypothetical protein
VRMGKSFELLGLMAFNVFLGLILSVNFINQTDAKLLSQLDEQNVAAFITQVADISTGKQGMDHMDVTEYFMSHIADNGTFRNRISYSMAYINNEDQVMEMDKLTYISHVIQSLSSQRSHQSEMEIEYIEIAEAGESATVMTVNYEEGEMPVQEAGGQARMIPVKGASYCEHELSLTEDKQIQLKGSNCMTDISREGAY